MVESNRQTNLLRLTRIVSNNNPVVNFMVITIIVIISIFLISGCFSADRKQYQNYQEHIIQLQQLDADFNQAVLKSRYELFTSYDPLVRNLQQQRSLLKELVKVPQFIELETKGKLNTALKEINTDLKRKIDLSDRFKSINALLKNSLRYLPLLANQLESKVEQQTQNLTSVQVTTLQSNLNQLIRKLLIYNVTADEKVQSEIESLKNQLLQLQIEYGLTPKDFAIDLVASHTNIILNTKPRVEELTSRLVIPVTNKTQVLKNLLNNSYQRANFRVNIYRIITIFWLLILLTIINILLLRQLRGSNPQFEQYKQKVRRIADALSQALAIKNSSESNNISNISDLTSCRDSLGNLANDVIKISNQIQQEQAVSLQEESLAFLTAQLTLVTHNNQNLFNPEMGLKLKVIFEIIFDSNDCLLIELQEARDRVQLLFRYPTKIKLSQLIEDIKIQSYGYFKQEFPESVPQITSDRQLWNEAYLIVSCDSNFLNPNQSDRFLVEKS